MDYQTGEVRVTGPLSVVDSPLLLHVGAADGGSPQRSTQAPLTIHVRDISGMMTKPCFLFFQIFYVKEHGNFSDSELKN